MATTEVDADATLLPTVLPSLLLPEPVSCLEVQVQRHRLVKTLNIVCVGLRKGASESQLPSAATEWFFLFAS